MTVHIGYEGHKGNAWLLEVPLHLVADLRVLCMKRTVWRGRDEGKKRQ
jgi:hypothetical protein